MGALLCAANRRVQGGSVPALLHGARAGQAEAAGQLTDQTAWNEFGHDRHTVPRLHLNGELVVPAPEILHERVPGFGHPRRATPLQPAHRPDVGLPPAVIDLDRIVCMPLGDVPTGRQQLVGYSREDLAGLVYRPVQVAPPATDLHIGLVDAPAAPGHMPAGAGRLDEQRGESAHPLIDGDVVDLDAALGEQRLDVPVRQPILRLSAHCQCYHPWWGAEPAEPEAPRRGEAAEAQQSSSPTDDAHRRRNSAGACSLTSAAHKSIPTTGPGCLGCQWQ